MHYLFHHEVVGNCCLGHFCLCSSRNKRLKLYNALLHSFESCPLRRRKEPAKVRLSSCAWSPCKASSPSHSISPSSVSLPSTSAISLARSAFEIFFITPSSPSTCKVLLNRADETDTLCSCPLCHAKTRFRVTIIARRIQILFPFRHRDNALYAVAIWTLNFKTSSAYP